jgi:hypothetical protein
MSEPMDSSQLTPPSRYWAFISYSHKDKSWGRWLHRSIETYGIPAELVGQHRIPSGHFAPKRFYQTFRDREELAASASLGEEIDKALRDSHYLIIICSPNAAQSKWVNQEVSTFQRLGRASQIFAVIVDGEPNTGDARECFPPALKRQEVIAADARPEGDGKNDAKLKLLAGMLGVSFDTLKKRDARRALRRMQVTVMFSLMLVLAFAALSLAIFQAKKSAESALRVSVAKTLAAQSFVESDRHLDLALLLCDKAESVDSNPETRSALYHVLQKCNRLDRFLWEKNDGVSESTEIEEIKFSPAGHTAAGACYDGKVALWNMDKPEDPAQIIMSKKDQFTTLAFNDEGTQLAAGGGEDVGVPDYNIYLYDLRKQMVIAKLEGATNPITAINFSADGKKLVSASADNIILWDLATTRAEWQFTVTNAIPSGYFNSKGQFVIFTEGDFVVCDAGLHQIIRHEKLPPNNWVFKSALCPSKGAAALLSDNNLVPRRL